VSKDLWATASARAFGAIVLEPDLSLGADFDAETFATPWGALGRRLAAWPREGGSAGDGLEERAGEFLRLLGDDDLRALGVGSRAWVMQRLLEAVGERPMGDGLTILAELRQAHDEARDAELAVRKPGLVADQLRPEDRFVRLAEIGEREVEWYWQGRIALANVTVIAGGGGVGKSTLAQELAARMTRGQAPPGGDSAGRRSVVILTAEEDAAAVVRPRMRLMGADLQRVILLDPNAAPLTFPSGAEALAQRCRAEDAGMLIVDTGPAFLDRGLRSNTEEDIRRFLAPLRALAEELRAVVLVLAHLNKDATRGARQRVMGGVAWVNAPRQVLMVGPPPGEDPRETGERLVAVEKNNLGVYPPAVAFRLAPATDEPSRAVVAWGGEVAGVRSADLVSEGPSSEERSERETAVEFLKAELAEGPRPVAELRRVATDLALAWRTVERAKRDLGVRAAKAGFHEGWTWESPDPPPNTAHPAAAFRSGVLGGLRENAHEKGHLGEAGVRRPPTSGNGGLRGETGTTDPFHPLSAAELDPHEEQLPDPAPVEEVLVDEAGLTIAIERGWPKL
jgi:hypothetical protein